MKAMPVIPSETLLHTTGRQGHPHCFACGDPSEGGLGLCFKLGQDGEVTTDWTCPAGTESYPGILHGGIIATLLDSAMVHALFARGVVARTGELQIRYQNPVFTAKPVGIRAWLRDWRKPLFLLEAELWQDSSRCARARAKFIISSSDNTQGE